MTKVSAEMHLAKNTDGPVWAYGLVTIEHLIRFSIQVRKIKKSSGEEITIICYPRRPCKEKWETVIVPEPELMREIRNTVMAELRTEIRKDLYSIPVEVIRLVRIEEPAEGNCPILAVATIMVCGLQIRGITVKQGKDGLFCNMPQYREEVTGKYRDMVYGLTKNVREQISQAVLDCYKKTGREE